MSGDAPHRNQLWADVLVAEFARGGLDHVALSPGSRSAPLAVAFADHPRITVSVHPDERDGAFFALGRARATGRPVATLTTSGTAVVNQYPAVMEAWQSQVPLCVISADRPPRLLDVGANQTIDQAGLFARHTNWNHTLGLPVADARSLRYLRSVAGRLLARCRGPPAGPVHLNVPFDEPLAPDPVAGDVPALLDEEPGGAPRADYLPWLAGTSAVRWPDPGTVDALAKRIAGEPGVIVVGPRHLRDAFPAAVLRLAKRLNAPVFADPLSGVRYSSAGKGLVFGTADAMCSVRGAREALTPHWVLQFGATPTSKHLLSYLEAHPQALRVMVDESGRHPDAVATAQVSVGADASRFALLLERRLQEQKAAMPRDRWFDLFRECDAAVRKVLDEGGEWEATIPKRVLSLLPSGGLLFVGSSLPVRDLDRFAPNLESPRWVLANRGASGIDGLIASASGAATGHGGSAAAVVGDVTFAHNVGALSIMKKYAPKLTLFVVRNGGGAIFGELPIARHEPPFTELFLSPVEMDVEALAKGYGLRHRLVGEGDDLKTALAGLPGGVVEIGVDRHGAHERRQLVQQKLMDVVKGTLG